MKVGYESVGRNKIRINPSQTLEGGKLFITGTVTPQSGGFGNAMPRFLMGLVTSVKNVSIGYTEDKGTTLPGFLPEARWLGQERFGGGSAPGFKFLFCGQLKDFVITAALKLWVTTDSSQTNPFLMNVSKIVYVTVMLEPIRKLRVTLSSNWTRAKNSSEYIIYDGN